MKINFFLIIISSLSLSASGVFFEKPRRYSTFPFNQSFPNLTEKEKNEFEEIIKSRPTTPEKPAQVHVTIEGISSSQNAPRSKLQQDLYGILRKQYETRFEQWLNSGNTKERLKYAQERTKPVNMFQ